MLWNGFNTEDRRIEYGRGSEYCWFCAEERAKENIDAKKETGISREAAGYELAREGRFDGTPMFRFPISGGPYYICPDHLREILTKIDSLPKPKTQ